MNSAFVGYEELIMAITFRVETIAFSCLFCAAYLSHGSQTKDP